MTPKTESFIDSIVDRVGPFYNLASHPVIAWGVIIGVVALGLKASDKYQEFREERTALSNGDLLPSELNAVERLSNELGKNRNSRELKITVEVDGKPKYTKIIEPRTSYVIEASAPRETEITR